MVQDHRPLSPLELLPVELQRRVATLCLPGSLAKLCLGSKLLNARLSETLYEEVDLSLRVNGIPIGQDERGSIDSVTEEERSICWSKQSYFLRMLFWRPEHSKWVRRIRWTLLYCMRSKTELKNEKEYRKVDSHEESCWKWHEWRLPGFAAYCEPLGMWDFLNTLSNVTQVELSEFLAGGFLHRATDKIPRNLNLFPKATSLSLIGDLSDTWVNTVLNINTVAQLKHIRLIVPDIDTFDHRDVSGGTISVVNELRGKLINLKSLEVSQLDWRLFKPNYNLGTELDAFCRLLGSLKTTLVKFDFKILSLKSSQYSDAEISEIALAMKNLIDDGSFSKLGQITILPKAIEL